MQSRIQGLAKRLDGEGRGAKLMSREPSVLEELGIADLSALLLHFKTYDPDAKGRHLTWMVNRYLESDYLLEDLPRLRESLSIYLNVKDSLVEELKDINRFPNVQKLEDLAEQYREVEVLSSREEERRLRDEVMAETKVLVDRPGFKAVIPMTVKASKWWGRGTRWCTAAQNHNMFESYSKEAPLIVFCWSDGTKWQFHGIPGRHGVQFMNEKDVPVTSEQIGERWEDVSPFLIHLLENRENLTEKTPFIKKMGGASFLIEKMGVEWVWKHTPFLFLETYMNREGTAHLRRVILVPEDYPRMARIAYEEDRKNGNLTCTKQFAHYLITQYTPRHSGIKNDMPFVMAAIKENPLLLYHLHYVHIRERKQTTSAVSIWMEGGPYEWFKDEKGVDWENMFSWLEGDEAMVWEETRIFRDRGIISPILFAFPPTHPIMGEEQLKKVFPYLGIAEDAPYKMMDRNFSKKITDEDFMERIKQEFTKPSKPNLDVLKKNLRYGYSMDEERVSLLIQKTLDFTKRWRPDDIDEIKYLPGMMTYALREGNEYLLAAFLNHNGGAYHPEDFGEFFFTREQAKALALVNPVFTRYERIAKVLLNEDYAEILKRHPRTGFHEISNPTREIMLMAVEQLWEAYVNENNFTHADEVVEAPLEKEHPSAYSQRYTRSTDYIRTKLLENGEDITAFLHDLSERGVPPLLSLREGQNELRGLEIKAWENSRNPLIHVLAWRGEHRDYLRKSLERKPESVSYMMTFGRYRDFPEYHDIFREWIDRTDITDRDAVIYPIHIMSPERRREAIALNYEGLEVLTDEEFVEYPEIVNIGLKAWMEHPKKYHLHINRDLLTPEQAALLLSTEKGRSIFVGRNLPLHRPQVMEHLIRNHTDAAISFIHGNEIVIRSDRNTVLYRGDIPEEYIRLLNEVRPNHDKKSDGKGEAVKPSIVNGVDFWEAVRDRIPEDEFKI